MTNKASMAFQLVRLRNRLVNERELIKDLATPLFYSGVQSERDLSSDLFNMAQLLVEIETKLDSVYTRILSI